MEKEATLEAALAAAAAINGQAAKPPAVAAADLVQSFAATPAMIEEADELISKDEPIPPFWQKKYCENVPGFWDRFYKRNSVNFFKDRMWLQQEFGATFGEAEQLSLEFEKPEAKQLLVEVGCGVGNTLFPLLFHNPNLEAIGLDCAPTAIELVAQRWEAIHAEKREAFLQPRAPTSRPSDGHGPTTSQRSDAAQVSTTGGWQGGRLRAAHVWDIAKGPVPAEIVEPGAADVVMLLFVLSAIPPEHHAAVMDRCLDLLRPGGVLLFRDYAKYDMTQVRFARRGRARIADNLYVRQDGTLAYFFTIEELRGLAKGAEVSSEYFLRKFHNRKTGQELPRIWVQAKITKGTTTTTRTCCPVVKAESGVGP